MKLFDLHCDTPFELYHQQKHLSDNDIHISLKKAESFEKYIQCAAIWSDRSLSDEECFADFIKICDYFKKEAGGFIKTANDLQNCGKNGFILAVEDSRLLSSDIERLSLLYSKGVRIMTLLWGGESSVGCAWDTDGSLTPFGKEVLEGCFDIGIIPDLSHANDKVVSYALERSKERKKPIIATHSNSRTVCPHKRNLTDELAKGISESGGIIGISLCPSHLRGDMASISDITDHISHYLNVIGTDALCLGCDFDGIGSTPEEINSLSDMPLLYDTVSKRFGAHCAHKIFFDNAYNFFINILQREI